MKLLSLIALNLLLVANTCLAGSLSKGDVVRLDFTGGAVQGGNGGGEFSIWKQVGTSFVFVAKTFCVERNEFFTPNQLYKVGAVSDRAIFGGENTDLGDVLNQTTKFLYNSYSNGTLASFGTGYSYGNVASAAALQKAIWFIEGEINCLTGDTVAQNLFKLATTQVTTNPNANYGVFALNLFDIATPDNLLAAFNPLDTSTWAALSGYRKQDQLYFVPEPTSVTIFALGAALAGASRLRSRLRRAKESQQ